MRQRDSRPDAGNISRLPWHPDKNSDDETGTSSYNSNQNRADQADEPFGLAVYSVSHFGLSGKYPFVRFNLRF